MRQIQKRSSFDKIILSPPYSNILSYKNTTPILGTYTKNRRPGRQRVFTTLRKAKDGWYNKSGLRNPGIENLIYRKNAIYSIALLKNNDWHLIRDVLLEKDISSIEFNVSCPNHPVQLLNPSIICQANYCFENVIIKMPHQTSLKFIEDYIEEGIHIIHISNTKPTDKGALSGKQLVYNNLKLIEELKEKYPYIRVIGGGGIYDIDTLKSYESAGADHFSLSTVLLNPIKTKNLIKEYYNE
jgi:dihydroorotate dehydrogenase